MLELSSSHATQLIAALVCGIGVFLATFMVSPKTILGLLVVTIPFQFVASHYGSLNMVLTYMVFVSLSLRSTIKSAPYLLTIFFILVTYFLSAFLSVRALWFDHLIYIITIVSNFLLFYITYNVILRHPEPRYFFRLLIVMNLLCVAYSIILYFVGYDKVAFLGVDEWTLNQNLEDKVRLMGAFQAAGVTAAFYASQILVLLYAAMFLEKGSIKYFCYAMALVNFALIVASGSRGSFLSLLGGCFLFMWFLRNGIGTIRMTRILFVGTICLVVVALYVVTQTEFNVMFERLAGTEINTKGVPDTRQLGFELTWKRLDEALVFGHGPEIEIFDVYHRHIFGYKPLGFYPHNLTLFLIYSLGFFGLSAYAIFFSSIFLRLFQASRNKLEDSAIRYLPVFGMVVMIMFFVDQLKIEFLRFNLADYQQYIFYLLALFAAFAQVARNKQLEAQEQDP